MPVDKYFKGKGRKVMSAMKKEYGEEGERAFYATANKRKMKPGSKKSSGKKR